MAPVYSISAVFLTGIVVCWILIASILNGVVDVISCTGPDCVRHGDDLSVSTDVRVKSKPKLKTRKSVAYEDITGNQKLIYLYGDGIWNKYDKFNNFDWKKCQPNYSKCKITTDETRISDSAAVVYNSLRMPTDDVIEKHKYRQFKRVFLSGKTPVSTQFDVNKFDDFFDYSITYKTDSDIRIPYWPNDGLLPAMYRPKSSNKVLYNETLLDLEDDVKFFFEKNGKDKFLSYTIKNCTDGLYNNLFAGKLRDEGNIEIFSTKDKEECMKIIKGTTLLPCKALDSDECAKHFEKYKFVIVADEELCTGYTTRDYWYSIIAWKSVPLLYGAGDYKKHIIPNSYIDCVGDEGYISPSFKKAYEPSEKSIDYYKTFQMWRHEDKIETYYWQCELCNKLQTVEETSKLKMSMFWNENKECGRSLDVYEKMRLQLVRTGVIS